MSNRNDNLVHVRLLSMNQSLILEEDLYPQLNHSDLNLLLDDLLLTCHVMADMYIDNIHLHHRAHTDDRKQIDRFVEVLELRYNQSG